MSDQNMIPDDYDPEIVEPMTAAPDDYSDIPYVIGAAFLMVLLMLTVGELFG